MGDETCDSCNGTGEHLCPDVAEPVMVPCSKKGCKFRKKKRKKTTTMSGVKYEWLVIVWGGPAAGWTPFTKKTGDFAEHMREFEAEKAKFPPGHVKSIHVCWLDDISFWGSPDEEKFFEDYGFDPACPKLSQNDARTIRHFRKFLEMKQKYGMDLLLKRPFWRRYLGLEEEKMPTSTISRDLFVTPDMMKKLREMYPGHFDDQEIIEKFTADCVMNFKDPQEELNRLVE